MPADATQESVRAATVASLLATVAVVAGFAEMSYGYYLLLRLFLCGVSLFMLAAAKFALADWQRWLLGGFAVLYNPIVPIRIGDKAIWEILNVITVALFWITVARQRR